MWNDNMCGPQDVVDESVIRAVLDSGRFELLVRRESTEFSLCLMRAELSA